MLSIDLFNEFAAVDDLEWSANAAHVLMVGIDAHTMADRSEEIGDTNRILRHGSSSCVGAANHLTTFHTPASHGD